MGRRTPNRAGPKGFTIIELLVVVAIMALVASMAVVAIAPMLRGRSMRSAAQSLQALIYQARSYAATYRKNATLYLGAPDGPLEVYPTLDAALARDPKRRVGGKSAYFPPGAVFLNDPPAQAGSGPRSTVVFSPTGSLDSDVMGTGPCQIRIADAQGQRRKVIEVMFASGLPRISDE